MRRRAAAAGGALSASFRTAGPCSPSRQAERGRRCSRWPTTPHDLETRSRVDAARPVIGLILARERAVRESERRLAGEVDLARPRPTGRGRRRAHALLRPRPGRTPRPTGRRGHRSGPRVGVRGAWLALEALNGVVALRGDELMVVLDGQPASGDPPPWSPPPRRSPVPFMPRQSERDRCATISPACAAASCRHGRRASWPGGAVVARSSRMT